MQVQSLKDNSQKHLVEKLESQAAYYSGRLRDDLQSITGEFLRKKEEKTAIEKETCALENFKYVSCLALSSTFNVLFLTLCIQTKFCQNPQKI